jgi:hypothetical protein
MVHGLLVTRGGVLSDDLCAQHAIFAHGAVRPENPAGTMAGLARADGRLTAGSSSTSRAFSPNWTHYPRWT